MAFRKTQAAALPRRPRILIFACGNYKVARVPRALQMAGAEVAIACYQYSDLVATRYSDWRYTLPVPRRFDGTGFGWLRLAIILAVLRPDIVIPGDEDALFVMIRLQRQLGPLTEKLFPGSVMALRRSVPPDGHVDAALRRGPNQRLAESLNIRCPIGTTPNSLAELEAFASKVGLPLVIKAEGTVAGNGVWICRTIEQMRCGWYELRDRMPGRRVLVQKFLEGELAIRSIAAVDGRVVGGLSMIKEHSDPETGPGTLVKIISHTEMEEAGDKIARALSLTGMASLDFIICSDGNASLIEYNPRLTAVCHLGPQAERLVEALRGRCEEAPVRYADGTRIALYPQEWVRCGGEVTDEPNLIRDIPVDDPLLLERMTQRLKNKLLGRWRNWSD